MFNLAHRQPHGIKVEEARRYLRRFGGVHVYDAGFHLPYYGPDTDWLRIEIDHSHRLSRSRLLPEDLQAENGLQDLPTNSRLFGVVNVDTGHEQRTVLERDATANYKALSIQVTRDRLADNDSYAELVTLVRWALDFYATRTSLRKHSEAERQRAVLPAPARAIDEAIEVLDEHREDLDQETFENLSRPLRQAASSVRSERAVRTARFGLLGALATAGISALAFEHEITKQLQQVEQLEQQLRSTAQRLKSDDLGLERLAERPCEVDPASQGNPSLVLSPPG